MLKKLTLQTSLVGSFVFMGSIVLAVAFVGWSGSSRLSQHLDTLNKDSLPSIGGLWKVNEGQTRIQSSEQALLNPQLSRQDKQVELGRIEAAWKQIKEGFAEYALTPQVGDQGDCYRQFLQSWEEWEKKHKEFLRRYQIAQVDSLSPQETMALNRFLAEQERTAFDAAKKDFWNLLEVEQEIVTETQKLSTQDVSRTSFLAILGMIVGPLAAIIFGLTIAKALSTKINATVNAIVSSSCEIAATVEQQERTAQEQASAVNQTTTTMDELGASSRQSTEQAEASAVGAQQVLALVDGRSQNGHISNASLREQVGKIAEQILRLSEQTNQIGTISTLVGDLANQTNMLALNAAVEAVRAGEHGKGFGVVASEIRKLADQSKKSAERISTLVIDIQNATSSTVMATDEGTKAVGKIVDAINAIAVNSQQISLTAKQQTIAIQQVVSAMNAINQGATQTATGISQTKVGTHKLNEAATQLKAIV